ncbi:30S ribosomal protein S5 [Candidatus Kaiserbacteria bacterium]|nr:30S ribosomal protein S5 [Candidatus Kaiserbacteria bacterium]MCB9818312.1 30S ribosomal protein S5 [Candidatus Nomurabacteria bacterium]
MSETKQQEATTDVKSDAVVEKTTEAVPTTAPATDAPAATTGDRGPRRRRGGNDRRGGGQGGRRPRRGGRHERVRPEFDQKIVSIRRVTRVMAGGRRFSFSVSMVIGDKKGKVGVGVGKAGDTQLAIEKAVRDAKKKMIVVPMDKDGRIPHDVHVKYASSEVMIMPAPGRGLVAGSSVRTVLELAGVKDVTAKLFSRSKNKLNNARAAVEALKQLKKG